MGWIEAITGIGLIMGPLIGTVLYAIGGYAFTFYSFSVFFVIFFCFISCLFPKKLDIISDEDKMTAQEQLYASLSRSFNGQIPEGEVSIGKLVSDRRFFFAGTTAFLGYFCYGYMEPLLAFRLKEFDLSQSQIGLFFAIMPVFYVFSSIMVQFTPKWIEKRLVLIVACLLSFMTNLFTGPSQVFRISNTLTLMAVG